MMETDLKEVRRYLHQHPELSGKEFKTQEYIQNFFREHCPKAAIIPLFETGFIVHFKGTDAQPRVMIRCELDALPIQEINDFSHKSKVENVSHKCGHDGHMAILMKTGLKLAEKPPMGDVYLLFQPAEEIGQGAAHILASETFQKLPQPAFTFALHNIPGAPLHSIHIRDNEMTPSVISVRITLSGKTAHAAEPQNGLNPALFISELQRWAHQHTETDPQTEGFQIITPVFIEMGTPDFGISAGSATLGFTMRTKTNTNMETLKENFVEEVERLSKAHKIPFEMKWFEEFRAVKNDEKSANFIRNAADELALKCVEKNAPFPWGEDFGLFTEVGKGALFGLGSGENVPALHNPDYDFPDALIETGSNIFYSIISDVQK